MSVIQGSVGKDGDNFPRDVKTVQRLLNKIVIFPYRPLSVDGVAGKNTIDTIIRFQSLVMKMQTPDGRVDPGGKTLRHLNRGMKNNQQVSDSSKNGKNQNLSGSTWWKANQSKYPNSKELNDLDGDFGKNATKFIMALRQAGASVSISSTRRNKLRAHLMHYSWKVAKGSIRAKDVPTISGLNIQWDHGNEKASRKGAEEMVHLFNMAHIASLKSNHIQGRAIDMSITWKGNLTLMVPGENKPITISSGPRSGAKNRDLHRVGRLFGLKKLLKDPPHWSHNGR